MSIYTNKSIHHVSARWLLVATIIATGLFCFNGSGAVLAQGVPVMDSSAISQLVENVNAVSQQVQQLNVILNQMQSLNKSIGQGGPSNWLSQTGANGSSPIADIIASARTSYANAQSLASAQQKIALLMQGGNNGSTISSSPDFSSFASSRTWVQNTLAAPPNAGLGKLDAIRKVRSSLAAESSADAYSLALSTRQNAPQTAQRNQSLANQAASATDIRSDIEANTAVMLAINDEVIRIEGLMAALLKLEASSRMATTDPSMSNLSSSPSTDSQ